MLASCRLPTTCVSACDWSSFTSWQKNIYIKEHTHTQPTYLSSSVCFHCTQENKTTGSIKGYCATIKQSERQTCDVCKCESNSGVLRYTSRVFSLYLWVNTMHNKHMQLFITEVKSRIDTANKSLAPKRSLSFYIAFLPLDCVLLNTTPRYIHPFGVMAS